MTRALSLPATPDEITPAWLTAVLRAAGLLRDSTVVAVDWTSIGEDRGFTGVVARIRPRYSDTLSADIVPASLVAKFPTAERTTSSGYRSRQDRDVAAARRHFERSAREVHFYREIGPRYSALAPRIYYAAVDEEPGRIMILMEDLSGARAGDALAGCSAQAAALVLDALAPFHADWWGGVDARLRPWLPRWIGDPRERQTRYASQIGPFLERFGDQLPPSIAMVVERLGERYAALLVSLDRAPQTVIHADLHLDNILFTQRNSGDAAVVLDWQSVALGAAAVDVALFLVGSLAADERRAAEMDLLRNYHQHLVRHGVAGYGLDRLREDLRVALVWLLAGTVGWLAGTDLDQLDGRERALVDAAIGDGRLVAALLDHDVARLVSAR